MSLQHKTPMPNQVTEATRRSIIDYFVISKQSWSGRLQEDEFLSRLYNLSELPSTDRRVRGAAADIRMHRHNFSDWGDDWVFYDQRFNLLHSSDDDFLRFLCETVHPVVRPDTENAHAIVSLYNSELMKDGFSIVEEKSISGKPVFRPKHGEQRIEVFLEPTGWVKVDRQLQAVRDRLDTAITEEHFQTVGLLCRECLISVAQEVFKETEHLTLDGIPASDTDAKRMTEAYLESKLAGRANEESRAHAKAAIRLALALQHKRSADFQTAALCAEACTSVVNIVSILDGRRNGKQA